MCSPNLPIPKQILRQASAKFFINFRASVTKEYKQLYSVEDSEFLKRTIHEAVHFDHRLEVRVTSTESTRSVSVIPSLPPWSDEQIFLHCAKHLKIHLLFHVPIHPSQWNSLLPLENSYSSVSWSQF